MHTSSMRKPKTMMPCSHQLLETIQLVITHAGYSDSLRTKVSMCRAMTSVLPKQQIIIINRGMSLQLNSFWVIHQWNPPRDTSNPIKTKQFRIRKTIFWNKTKRWEISSDWYKINWKKSWYINFWVVNHIFLNHQSIINNYISKSNQRWSKQSKKRRSLRRSLQRSSAQNMRSTSSSRSMHKHICQPITASRSFFARIWFKASKNVSSSMYLTVDRVSHQIRARQKPARSLLRGPHSRYHSQERPGERNCSLAPARWAR